MDLTKHISHFKLLSPTTTFSEKVTSSGTGSSVLQARLVYSWLAYRSRLDTGSSTRDIRRQLGMHSNTVSDTVRSLSGLVERRQNAWFALEPTPELFVEIRSPRTVNHWSDRFAYGLLFLPKRGALVQYPETTRKFAMNHALIWSFLFRQAKENVVRRFTVAGVAKMFSLDPKTVKAVLDDLLWLRMVEREDLGRSSDITLLPVTEDHLALFEPKPKLERVRIEPTEKKPRSAQAPYVYRGDEWDSCLRLCDGLMPQKQADAAICKAKRLGDAPEDFDASFRRAKEFHEKNILSGKVAKGNFGKYLNACFNNRIDVLEKQEREETERQRFEAWLSSPEYRQKCAIEKKAAAADPLHPQFSLSDEAVFDRVQFDEAPLKNYQLWHRLHSTLGRHIQDFIRTKGLLLQDEVNSSCTVSTRILQHALATVNGYYKQSQLASPEQFRAAIDSAIRTVAPGMKLLFQSGPTALDNSESKNS